MTINAESLIRRFADAGLTLKVSDTPIIRGVRGGEIVQIDIARDRKGNRRFEWFRIYPGADENRIEVTGTDKRIGQLVLMVHEPPRTFTESVGGFTLKRAMENFDPTKGTIMAHLASTWGVRPNQVTIGFSGGNVHTATITRKTSSDKRHFLMGLDERQLFIAQLRNGVSTVREAHASLKGTNITLAEGNMGPAVRQGEWFFIRATDREVRDLENGLKKCLLKMERKVPIGAFYDGNRGGNPHTVDQLVVVPVAPKTSTTLESRVIFPVRQREVFILGKVRHVDHKTVEFKSWHKVIRNSEGNAGQGMTGVGWID